MERKTLSTDVLIVGGGIGGLTAACSIKEHSPETEVLIIEKQTAGFSGKANKGGGVLQYFDLEHMEPMENSVYMNEYRLNIALRKLEEVKKLVPQMRADDLHWMLTCHEAEAGVLCAEMQLRASLMRKESRGWFLREDYPRMDNENYLKYITVQNVNGEVTFSMQDVPVDRWPIKPHA